MGTWMYYLVKNAARESCNDFLEYIGISSDEYLEIREYVEKTLNVKLYV